MLLIWSSKGLRFGNGLRSSLAMLWKGQWSKTSWMEGSNIGLSVGTAGVVEDKRVCVNEDYHVTVNHGAHAGHALCR